MTTMYGDGEELQDKAVGGDDILIGGAGAPDTMWGDAARLAPGARTGTDLFVFHPGGGHDAVMDFEPGRDHLELVGFGVSSLADLEALSTVQSDGLRIEFTDQDSIFLRNLGGLNAGDVIFG